MVVPRAFFTEKAFPENETVWTTGFTATGGKAVTNAVDAARELQTIQAGRLAQLRVWRADKEIFVPVKKD